MISIVDWKLLRVDFRFTCHIHNSHVSWKITSVLNSSHVIPISLCIVTTVMYTSCRHDERRQCAKGNQNHVSDQVMGKYLSWESISVVGCLPSVSELLNLIPSVWQTNKKTGASHVFVCLLPILFLRVLLNYSLFLRLECTFSCMCTVVVLLKE